MLNMNRRKFFAIAIPTAAVVGGAVATEYYIAPGAISQLISQYLSNKKTEPTLPGNILKLYQNVAPETVNKVYLTKGSASKFSQSDSDLLSVTVNLENISDAQLENVDLENYGLKGFLYKYALLGNSNMEEKDFVNISPIVNEDKVIFDLKSLPINGKSILKLIYIPQQEAQDSLVTSKATVKYKTQNLSLDASTDVKVKDVNRNLIDLELRLFHDYHGDGAKQEDEPVITDAVFDVRDYRDEKILTGIKGNGNGIYKIEDLKEGLKYRLSFSSETEKKYRYISISNNEFRSIGGYDFTANTEKTKVDLGIMNGYLTLPFEKNIFRSFLMYFDRGGARGWKGGPSYPGHVGTDFNMESGTKLVAPASGKIVAAFDDWPHSPETKVPDPGSTECGNFVMIALDNGMSIYCAHISKLLVDRSEFNQSAQRVKRGEGIALSGNTGIGFGKRNISHLHLGLMSSNNFVLWGGSHQDPFGEYSAWTKNNDPQYSIKN